MIKWILSIGLISLNCYAITFNEFLADAGISHKELGKTVLEKNFKVFANNSNHYLLSFSDEKNNLFDIEIQTSVPPQTAKSQITNYGNLLKMSYSDKPSPYAGIISNIEKCPAKYAPKIVIEKFNNTEVQYYISTAGARFQYGACTADSAVYSVCTLFYYHQNNSTFEKVKYFVPVKNGNCREGIKTFFTGLKLK